MEPRSETRHRLFLGIPVPAEAAEALAVAAREGLTDPKLRFIRPENLHVTLIFFGDVDAAARDELITLTSAVEWEPIPVQSGPVARMGRTAIAVRLRTDPLALVRLEDRLVRGSRRHSGEPDELWTDANPFYTMLKYIPEPEMEKQGQRERKGKSLDLHVTVARAKTPPSTLPLSLVELEFDLARVVLYESHLGPDGSRYVPLASSRT